MRSIGKGIQIVVAATLLAAAITLILALPGFLSDRASTVPVHMLPESGR